MSPEAQPNQFVLNAEALLPLRQLFIGFGVVAVSYYWFQVYTRSLSFNLNAVLFDAGIGERGFGVASESRGCRGWSCARRRPHVLEPARFHTSACP